MTADHEERRTTPLWEQDLRRCIATAHPAPRESVWAAMAEVDRIRARMAELEDVVKLSDRLHYIRTVEEEEPGGSVGYDEAWKSYMDARQRYTEARRGTR